MNEVGKNGQNVKPWMRIIYARPTGGFYGTIGESESRSNEINAGTQVKPFKLLELQ